VLPEATVEIGGRVPADYETVTCAWVA